MLLHWLFLCTSNNSLLSGKSWYTPNCGTASWLCSMFDAESSFLGIAGAFFICNLAVRRYYATLNTSQLWLTKSTFDAWEDSYGTLEGWLYDCVWRVNEGNESAICHDMRWPRSNNNDIGLSGCTEVAFTHCIRLGIGLPYQIVVIWWSSTYIWMSHQFCCDLSLFVASSKHPCCLEGVDRCNMWYVSDIGNLGLRR